MALAGPSGSSPRGVPQPRQGCCWRVIRRLPAALLRYEPATQLCSIDCVIALDQAAYNLLRVSKWASCSMPASHSSSFASAQDAICVPIRCPGVCRRHDPAGRHRHDDLRLQLQHPPGAAKTQPQPYRCSSVPSTASARSSTPQPAQHNAGSGVAHDESHAQHCSLERLAPVLRIEGMQSSGD